MRDPAHGQQQPPMDILPGYRQNNKLGPPWSAAGVVHAALQNGDLLNVSTAFSAESDSASRVLRPSVCHVSTGVAAGSCSVGHSLHKACFCETPCSADSNGNGRFKIVCTHQKHSAASGHSQARPDGRPEPCVGWSVHPTIDVSSKGGT